MQASFLIWLLTFGFLVVAQEQVRTGNVNVYIQAIKIKQKTTREITRAGASTTLGAFWL
jgi:hypothetical protein